MGDVPCFVGIDGAKAQWDIARRPTGERWAVPNDARGIAPRVDRLGPPAPLLVREATGGLERAATVAWAAAGLPVVVVNPRQARDCARATGPWAKTDALDARALAHFADGIRPPPRPLPDAQTQALRALLGRRQPLIVMRTAEQHRLAGASERLTQDITAPMTWRNADIAPLDNDLEDAAAGQPAVAGTRRSVAACQGHWARACPHVAAGTPRVGDAHATAERGLGRCGAPPWRQWDHAGQAHALGRAGACAHRVIHAHTRGDSLQPPDHRVVRAAPRRGERQASRPDSV